MWNIFGFTSYQFFKTTRDKWIQEGYDMGYEKARSESPYVFERPSVSDLQLEAWVEHEASTRIAKAIQDLHKVQLESQKSYEDGYRQGCIDTARAINESKGA